MNLDINSKFKVQFLNSPIEIQKKAIELLQLIQKSENINHLNSSALVGFPYIHKIAIEGYSFCFYIGKDKLEILGLVETGSEFVLLV